MTHLRSAYLTAEVRLNLRKLGENVRLARRRRRWTLEHMARTIFVSRKTLMRLEKGDPGTGIGVLASALEVLGMSDAIGAIADPAGDIIGLFQEKRRLPRRVREKAVRGLDF